MAYRCKHGGGECDGCGYCFPPEEEENYTDDEEEDD